MLDHPRGIAAGLTFALFVTGTGIDAYGRTDSLGHTYHPPSHYYTNVDGNRVHRPVFNNVRPSGATAQCADGSWSFSLHRNGKCSHHGGVADW